MNKYQKRNIDYIFLLIVAILCMMIPYGTVRSECCIRSKKCDALLQMLLLIARLIIRQDMVFDEWRMFGCFGIRQCW